MESGQKRGLLVAFEGIDGAGKSTQIRLLEKRLAEAGIPFVTTREPTDGPWGRKIRESARTGRMSPEEERDAFLADRREHVRDVIAPALASGQVVIVDRYYFSTVAYQGARGLDPGELLRANAFAPEPDVLIVLDLDPKAGLERVEGRGAGADLFEKEDYLARVRETFLSVQARNKVVLDAKKDPEALGREIADLVLGRLT